MELKQEAVDAIIRKLAVAGHDVTTAQARSAIEAFLSVGGYNLIDRTFVVADDSFNTQLLAEDESVSDRAYRKLVVIEEEITNMIADLKHVEDGQDDGEWRLVYESVFGRDYYSLSEQVRDALGLMGDSFPDYYDPDTTYEEDSLAWIEAFRNKLSSLTSEREQAASLQEPSHWVPAP